jgi:hypothetical protein
MPKSLGSDGVLCLGFLHLFFPLICPVFSSKLGFLPSSAISSALALSFHPILLSHLPLLRFWQRPASSLLQAFATPSHSHFSFWISCFRLRELWAETQDTALTGTASLSFRAIPAHRHPAGDRTFRALPAEAPQPRCACDSRQETDEGLTKVAAPLDFLLAGEALSCRTVAGPALLCLCPELYS